LGSEPESIDALVSSPQDTGAESGEYCAIWLGPELPADQLRENALSCCFDVEILTEPTGIIGAPQLRLALTSDQVFGQIAVRLCEVFPDGASSRLSYGVLNMTHRDDAANPRPVVANKPYEVVVNLDHMACTIAVGNRLCVAISSAYWPLVWPTPGAVQHRILGGKVSFSGRNSLGKSEIAFSPAEASTPWKHAVIREAAHQRRRETDLGTGVVTLNVIDDFGAAEDADHGLIAGSIARESWTIHPDEPLSAKGSTHWTQTLARGDWTIRTEARQTMWSDAEFFYQSAEIEAFEGDEQIFHREFSAKVKRDMM